MAYLFVAGISIALFLVLILLTRPHKRVPDYILAALLFFSAQTIFNTFWVYTGLYLTYPDILVAGINTPILVAPLFFLYTKYQTHNTRFLLLDCLHLLPFIILSLFYARFYGLSFEDKLKLMQPQSTTTLEVVRVFTIYLSGFFYFLWSLWILTRFRKNMKNEFSNTEKIQFNWLLSLIIGMLIIWLVVLIFQDDRMISVSSTVFVVLLGYFGITQVNAFSGTNSFFFSTHDQTVPANVPPETTVSVAFETRYRNSLLSAEEAEKMHTRLKELLENKRPYLNPELTLAQLAQQLSVHPGKLSEVINTREGKTFYDLINELRIKEFLSRVLKPENKQFTFMSLAYDCGFNSKASFNRNFKKHTGKAPTEFLKDYPTPDK